MIELNQVRLRQGDRLLFDTDSLRIADGWHVGVTGRNGSGKTSLFHLLKGERDADAGTVNVTAGQRLACMAQEVPGLAQTALSYVQEGDERLLAAQRRLHDAETANDGHAIGAAHALLDTLDAWTAEARAASLMAGLGFSAEQQQLPVADFSGGWRMRLNLARTLMAQGDVLLLDEPTNHLDLDAILWLGDTLKNYPGTLLLVSHDRHFLDTCVNHILHIEHAHLTHYSGNYSSFERQRGEQLAQQQKAFEKQQAQRAHLQSFIDRFQYKATKARQAQSRIKALERLTLSAPAHVDSGFSFSIQAPERLPDPLLSLADARLGYDVPLLHDIELTIRPDTRLGLLGANGAGKSTLIKSLAGLLPLHGGQRQLAPGIGLGYFHQQQIDQLDMQASPFALMEKARPDLREVDIRKELGKFDFQGERVFERIEGFSGGEKTRLALALLIQQKPALLLLDEPTNHLDIEMREALALALQDYTGAVVLISHDVALLDATVDEYLLVAEGRVTVWQEDLQAYARHLKTLTTASAGPRATAALSVTTTANTSNTTNAKDKRRDAAQKRHELRPLKQKVERLEKDLEQQQQALHQLRAQLADDTLYQPARKTELQQALTQEGTLTQSINTLEEQLLLALEALEAAEQN